MLDGCTAHQVCECGRPPGRVALRQELCCSSESWSAGAMSSAGRPAQGSQHVTTSVKGKQGTVWVTLLAASFQHGVTMRDCATQLLPQYMMGWACRSGAHLIVQVPPDRASHCCHPHIQPNHQVADRQPPVDDGVGLPAPMNNVLSADIQCDKPKL